MDPHSTVRHSLRTLLGARTAWSLLILLVALPLVAACGAGGDDGTDGDDGPVDRTPLGSAESVRGEDDTLLGATEGAVDAPIDVSIESADADAATDAELDVETLGSAYRFSAAETVVTDTSAPFVVGLPLDAVCPDCGDGPIEDLAIAVLLPGENSHGDPFPGVESRDHGGDHPPDRWSFRQAFHDEDRGLLLTTIHSLTEEGRVVVAVRDDDFSTKAASQPEAGTDRTETAQSDPSFQMRCHPTDFDNVSFSCGPLDTNAAEELFETAYDDYTALGFTDTPNIYRVPEVLGIIDGRIEPWAEPGAYVMTLRACSEAIADVGDPGHYWGSKVPGDVYACYGANVNWKKTPNPPRARWVEDIIRHETFHGVQSDYLSSLSPVWVTEGTANAAQESLAVMAVSRNGDEPNDAGARHPVDEPLTASDNSLPYQAEDFWVWLGQRLNQARVVGEERGLDYLIPFFERGTSVTDVHDELQTTKAYDGTGLNGLQAAYLDWVRNQAFEKSIQLGPDTLGDVCAYNGQLVDNLITFDYQPDQAPPADQTVTIDPLNSRVVRFDFGEFILGPYETLASVSSTDTAVKIKFFDADDASTVACRSGAGTSEVGSHLVQHQARDGSHRHYALVTNTDLSQGHDVTLSVTPNEQGVFIIAPGDGATYDEGEKVYLEAVATGFDDYGSDLSIEWSYEDESGSKQVIATTDSRETLHTEIPCFTGALTAEATSDGQSASTFVNVDCTPAQEDFLFLIDAPNSGYVSSDGTVQADPYQQSVGILVGDTEGGSVIRGYLDFDLSTLPDSVTGIVSAELRVSLQDFSGDAFGKFGELNAIHDEYGDLDAGDYPNSTPRPGLATLADAATFGHVTVDVTTAVKDAWDNRSTYGEDVQFIVYFEGPNLGDDTDEDIIEIEARNPSDAAPVAPTLNLTVQN
jgi:hypothetical protein